MCCVMYWAIGYAGLPGHPQGETSLRVCRVWSGYEKFHKTLDFSNFQGITEVGDCLSLSFQCGHIIYTNNIGPLPCQ